MDYISQREAEAIFQLSVNSEQLSVKNGERSPAN